jgi:hypothetical protein
MIMLDVEWLLGNDGKAHLKLRHENLTWCGVYASTPAPYKQRCKTCLKRVERYAKEAAVEPPQRVLTCVTLAIEHNADLDPDEVLRAAIRRIQGTAKHSTFEVTGDVVTSVEVSHTVVVTE